MLHPFYQTKVFSLIVWNLGWIVLGATWLGPLPSWAMNSFAAHMALHMAIVAIAAPLLSIGASGRRYDPVRKWPRIFSPVLASVGELIIVWTWHTPRLHHWARFDTIGFVGEQGMFLGAGLWMWLSAFGGSRPRSMDRSAAGVIGLLLTSMHMTLLGALLALSNRVLFMHHTGTLFFNELTDQHLGGTIMLLVGGVAFLAGGLWLVRELLVHDGMTFEKRFKTRVHGDRTIDGREFTEAKI